MPCVSPSSDDAASGDDTPICWLCHDGGSEDEPLVRDCSCRGNSGHAHLSCLASYAEHQSNLGESGKFIKAWATCPNCLQGYEELLANQLVEKCLEFVEREHPDDRWYATHGLYVQMRSIKIDPTCKDEAERVALQLISTVEEIKSDAKANGVGSINDSFLYFEVTAQESIGLFGEAEGTREGLKVAMERYQRCSEIYTELGVPLDVQHAEACLARARSKYTGDNSWTVEQALKDCQDYYDEACEESGKDSKVALISLWRLADALKDANRRIASTRALKELIATSRRIHGAEHSFTKEAEETLVRHNKRQVIIRGWRSKRFRAQRYIQEEDKYEVKGPIQSPSKPEEEKTFTVHAYEVRPTRGTPIVCHGIEVEGMKHLNGKMGDVQSREKGRQKYTVHFDDDGIGPCLVHPRHMRILFDIPSEDEV